MINKLFSTLAKVGINSFFFMLIGAIILAWIFPSVGNEQSWLHLHEIAGFGVSLIFLFYGLKLSPKSLFAGLSNWRLHLVVQLSTFLLFPLIILTLRAIFPIYFSGLIGIGIFFLAVLPSTVSSSVVLVSIAGGNVAAAIFNASVSSIIGIFITPLWMSWLTGSSATNFDISTTIVHLCIQVLLPFVVGLLLHSQLRKLATKHKIALRNFDQTIILLIVFTSFCDSFSAKMFNNLPFFDILFLAFAMLAFFFSVFFIMNFIAKLFKFNRADRITILFCGSKKSLVQGVVMGKVLFAGNSVLGVVLLPLMLYHALQLLAGSAIAQSLARNENSNSE